MLRTAASLALVLSAQAIAQTTHTLNPTADAHVRSGPTYQNTNYGSATSMDLKKSASATDDFNREIYLKFNIADATSVRSAKLRVYGSETAPEAVTTDLYSSANIAWTEGGITWANKPSTGPMIWSNTALGSTAQYREWDVTTFLAGEKIQGRNEVTLVLKNAVASTTGTIAFNARNAANPPQLVIEEAHAWRYYEAEAGTRAGGATLNTGVQWGDVAFEARGKKTVTLTSNLATQHLTWSGVKSGTHATLRYSLNDGGSGSLLLETSTDGGTNWVNRGTFTLTSAGMREFRGSGNAPADGIVRYFEDATIEATSGIPNNCLMRVRKSNSGGSPIAIDFIDVETRPAAIAKPDNTWVVVAQGTGDDRAAIVAAIATANSGSKKVWLPAGTYTINLAGGPANGGIQVNSGVTIRGAGMWHTTLIMNYGGDGRRLFSMNGTNTMKDFKVVSIINTLDTNPNYTAFRAGDDSAGHVVEGIWAERVTLFLGLRVDNCIVRNCRVRNTYKDSIHFAQGSSNNLVEYNTIRNSGDDNVAFVAYEKTDMFDNTVQYNLGECGWWGRGFTNIGGDGNIFRYNVAVDCTKAGIASFIEDFGGLVTQYCTNFEVSKNVAIGCGNQNLHPMAAGIAIYVGGGITGKPMSGYMEDNLVLSPPYTGARLQGQIGLSATGDKVYFRRNGLAAPVTVIDGTQHVRKYTAISGGSNIEHTPNNDL